jgi:hypothetical protein
MTTRENISLGAAANDATGDTLRGAGGKINRNFVKIFQMLGSDSDYLSAQLTLDSDGIIYNGSSFTTELTFTEPTANRTITFPDATGTVSLSDTTENLENKTLINPIILDNASGVDLLKFTSVAASVNELTISNNSTGNPPILSATGDNTNINLNLDAKGTGAVRVSKLAIESETLNSDGACSLDVGYTIFNGSAALTMTLNNGTTVGEQKIFTNKGAGTATVTPVSFAQGTSFSLVQYTGSSAIWDGTNWYLYSHDSDVTIA